MVQCEGLWLLDWIWPDHGHVPCDANEGYKQVSLAANLFRPTLTHLAVLFRSTYSRIAPSV
jgi:hypothetical protein